MPGFLSLRGLIGLHRLSDRRKRGIGIRDFDIQPGIMLVGEANGDGFVRVVDIAEHPLSRAEKASGLDYPRKIGSWGSQRLPVDVFPVVHNRRVLLSSQNMAPRHLDLALERPDSISTLNVNNQSLLSAFNLRHEKTPLCRHLGTLV